MNPLELIAKSKEGAVEADGFHGKLCQLATVDSEGNPRVRTVIMHDVTETAIGCIYSKFHQKTPQLDCGKFQIFIWHPSQGNQFMVNGTIEPMPTDRLLKYWNEQLPTPAKYLDKFYESSDDRRPASPRPNREVLVSEFENYRKMLDDNNDPLDMPGHVIGSYFVAERIEHLQVESTDGRFHKRGLYELKDGDWGYTVWVP